MFAMVEKSPNGTVASSPADKERDDFDAMEETLLLVDDDGPFLRRLARAMESRGFAVETAERKGAGYRVPPR